MVSSNHALALPADLLLLLRSHALHLHHPIDK